MAGRGQQLPSPRGDLARSQPTTSRMAMAPTPPNGIAGNNGRIAGPLPTKSNGSSQHRVTPVAMKRKAEMTAQPPNSKRQKIQQPPQPVPQPPKTPTTYPPPTTPAPTRNQQAASSTPSLETRLRAFLQVENHQQTHTSTQNQPTTAAVTEIVEGPVTEQENAKALLEGVKEKIKVRGRAWGTNPDYSTAAEPRMLMRVRREWTEEAAMREAVREGGWRYVPAESVNRG